MRTSTVVHRIDRGTAAVEVRTPPRAPARAMQVVEALAQSRDGLSLAALSAALALPKTSLLHLMRALEAARYVQRVPAGFQLGVGSYRLAAMIDATNGFAHSSQQVLHELLQQTRETVLIGQFAPDRLSGIYIDRLPSPQAVRFTPDLNIGRPLYCTAMGKVLLAFAGDETLATYLQSVRLSRFTDRTLTSKRALRAELAEVRANGFARSADEMLEGGGALAAPVFDQEGRIRMSLVIAAPTARLLAHGGKWSTLLKDAAAGLSGVLGPTERPRADPG
ncbi:IclR family transcriptional regulator [Variovorax sp. PBL-E5]|uniref:IclR family transcriptional regulator n=1 Tax=Variovorax sp. PBL-E5 TaxID=434014 RepID=UPI0013A54003|nr:IclR family transcriptional regulator [Variovorax sp. PBL-E5]